VRVTVVLSGQWSLVSDKYVVLPGAEDLCGDIGTPTTSSPLASTSSQNKPKKKKNSSSNVDVCYNHFMPMGGKIPFISVSLWNIITSHIMYVLQFSGLCFHLLIFFKEIVFCIENRQCGVKMKFGL
jgi:hypothetical protein